MTPTVPPNILWAFKTAWRLWDDGREAEATDYLFTSMTMFHNLEKED